MTLRRGLLRLAQLLMNVYIQVFRGTPMIVQAVVIYYGAQYAGVYMDTTFAAIFIISINTGAYMAEIIRGGIVSVDKGQFEAAHAIGMTHWQTMTTVVLPQAIRNILPSVGNELDRQHQGFQRAQRHLRLRAVLPGEERRGHVLPLLRGLFHHRGDLPHPDAERHAPSCASVEKKMDGPDNYVIHGSQSDSRADIKVSVENEKEAVKSMERVIEVRGIKKAFGDHEVLRGVDFAANKGEVTCIIGSSGSGKSTLLRCINLLETPDEGQILYHGEDILSGAVNMPRYHAKVGMVFQQFNLFGNMDRAEQLRHRPDEGAAPHPRGER